MDRPCRRTTPGECRVGAGDWCVCVWPCTAGPWSWSGAQVVPGLCDARRTRLLRLSASRTVMVPQRDCARVGRRWILHGGSSPDCHIGPSLRSRAPVRLEGGRHLLYNRRGPGDSRICDHVHHRPLRTTERRGYAACSGKDERGADQCARGLRRPHAGNISGMDRGPGNGRYRIFPCRGVAGGSHKKAMRTEGFPP